jgi:hypothetical protein
VGFGLAQDLVDHRAEAVFVLEPDMPQRRAIDGDGSRRQHPLRLQLLAAQRHQHHLAAEIRVAHQVAQRADRDVGTGRLDGDAAAVTMLQADHAIDIRVARQQLAPDAVERCIQHAGHALHGGGDGEQIARADAAVGIAVALEAEALQRRERGLGRGCHRQAVQGACRRQAQQLLVHPTAGGDG